MCTSYGKRWCMLENNKVSFLKASANFFCFFFLHSKRVKSFIITKIMFKYVVELLRVAVSSQIDFIYELHGAMRHKCYRKI